MAKSTQPSPIKVTFFVLLAVAAVGFMIVTLQSTLMGPRSTTSKASRNDTLTASDDALSLQQDLNVLQNDPTLAEEAQLNNLE